MRVTPTMRKKGLTLVELMATLVIAAMVTAAALAAVADLARVEGMERNRQQEVTWLEPVRNLLASDLVHATQYQAVAGGFALKAQASLDADTMEQRHLPASVQYVVRRIGARSWLVRVEQPETGGNGLTELVCPDVKSILLEPVPEAANASGTGAPPPSTEPDGWAEVPAAVVITVVRDAAEQPEVVFTVRRN